MNIGQWGTVIPLGFIAIHLTHLHTGELLMWDLGDDVHHKTYARLWDPLSSGNPVVYENHNQNLFCSGHAQTAFGNLIAAGGHISAGIGTNQSDLFTPQQNTWTALPLMFDDQEEPYTRWYPSVTTMADGRLIVTGGSYGLDLYRTKPHIYSPQSNTWEFLSSAENLEFDYYPFMFVLPKAVSLRDNNNVLRTFPPGSLVCVGWRQETRVLGYVNNTWLWSNYINNSGITHSKDYSSAVMYEPGKIMKCGGGWGLQDGATDLTIHVDFTTSGPYSWKKETFANSQMAYGRRNFDLVILADGTVLAVGGNRGPLGNDVPGEDTKRTSIIQSSNVKFGILQLKNGEQ